MAPSPADMEFPMQQLSGLHRTNSSAAMSIRSGRSVRSNGSTKSEFDDGFRYRTMINYLHTRISSSGWMSSSVITSKNAHECHGVLLRKARGQYITSPEQLAPSLLGAVQRVNVEVAFTMRPQMLDGILASLVPGQTDLKLGDGSQLQIVGSLDSMTATSIKKFQYACLVKQERMLLVWHDDLQNVVPHATKLEERLLALVWGTSALPFSLFQAPSRPMSMRSGSDAGSIFKMPMEKLGSSYLGTTFNNDSTEALDKDDGFDNPESLNRPVQITSAFFVGLGIMLAVVLIFGFFVGNLVVESMLDGFWQRLGLLFFSPIIFCASLFFFQSIFGNIFQMIGPIGGYTQNSKHYSCIKPSLRRAYDEGFSPPHVTIQMPVYKEGMEGVIIPTVRSLQTAISFYESHGGSASIFINDDGLRVIGEEEAKERIEFYHDNNIGWTARPKHGFEGFERKGKFKKASNMNFALNISMKVEAYLQQMVDAKFSAEGTNLIEDAELDDMYQTALARVLEENPLARAAGNIRMGEIILIVDSDTRVPVDSLLYGAAEMFLSPEVAIVQHSTGVMQVTWDYFENGITFFTNMVYTAIRFTIGSGEVAPFVGHNAFLRWQAVQGVGKEEAGGYVAYWSESHVSEDFDIALRVQIAGSVVRIASYHGDGFQEGVSLTIYDEIARWQKYAYGCSEMIFHPLHQWIFKGPFTPLFKTFLGSNIMLSSKFGIFAYICSYFSLAAGFPLTLMNYVLVGWFSDSLDHYYLDSWKVLISLLLVFNIMSNTALAAIRYRTGERSLLSSLWENFKWMPLMSIFFGGLSFHVSGALLAHLFHIDMQWGATSKEKENSNFFQEVPKILKAFKIMYTVLILISGAMVYIAIWAPRGWEIRDYTAIVPLAIAVGSHALTPVALNPSLMVFNY